MTHGGEALSHGGDVLIQSSADAKAAWSLATLRAPHDVPDKSDRVRRMFNAIAPAYERVNTVFSAGRDAAWRRRAVMLGAVTCDDDVLDVACGTGDFSRAFAAVGPRRVVGADFAHNMLTLAVRRPAASFADATTIRWCEADAVRLPFADGSFSVAASAFGVRNFADLDAGLAEMRRVLRCGGRIVILEFSRPRQRFVRSVYELYANRFMPRAAAWLAGDRTGAYQYLPRSVVSFPDAVGMCDRLRRAGFQHPVATPLTMGIVTVYVAQRV